MSSPLGECMRIKILGYLHNTDVVAYPLGWEKIRVIIFGSRRRTEYFEYFLRHEIDISIPNVEYVHKNGWLPRLLCKLNRWLFIDS
jgi:hypothetical protein